MDEILTGKELCILFKIDYNEITKVRTAEQQTNLEYFVEELIRISGVKYMLIKKLKKAQISV